MMPKELRPAPGGGVYSRLIIPKAVEVLRGVSLGEDIEEEQELPVDPARGGHGTWEEGVGGAISVGDRWMTISNSLVHPANETGNGVCVRNKGCTRGR